MWWYRRCDNTGFIYTTEFCELQTTNRYHRWGFQPLHQGFQLSHIKFYNASALFAIKWCKPKRFSDCTVIVAEATKSLIKCIKLPKRWMTFWRSPCFAEMYSCLVGYFTFFGFRLEKIKLSINYLYHGAKWGARLHLFANWCQNISWLTLLLVIQCR